MIVPEDSDREYQQSPDRPDPLPRQGTQAVSRPGTLTARVARARGGVSQPDGWVAQGSHPHAPGVARSPSETVEAAIHSQLVYYVDDLDFSKTPSFPPTTDTAPERILRAISNNQIVSGQ